MDIDDLDFSQLDPEAGLVVQIGPMLSDEMRKDLLKEHGDTYPDMPWDEFKKIMVDNVFFPLELVYTEEIDGGERCVWIDGEQHGIILIAESKDDQPYRGMAQFQAVFEEAPKGPWECKVEGDHNGKDVLHFRVPVCAGFVYWMLSVIICGTTIKPWRATNMDYPPYLIMDEKPVKAGKFEEIFKDVPFDKKKAFIVASII